MVSSFWFSSLSGIVVLERSPFFSLDVWLDLEVASTFSSVALAATEVSADSGSAGGATWVESILLDRSSDSCDSSIVASLSSPVPKIDYVHHLVENSSIYTVCVECTNKPLSSLPFWDTMVPIATLVALFLSSIISFSNTFVMISKHNHNKNV